MNANTYAALESGTPRAPLVWDAPVRLFHWLLVAMFAVAWITAESDRWMLAHVTAGYTMAGLVVFRLAWGLVGTTHARFADFVRGPKAVMAYVGSMLRGRPEHHTGHNPAGAIAIIGMLALTALTVASGWALQQGIAGEALEDLHEAVATGLLALALVHVGAVVLSSALHGDNLVAAMLHGRKPAPPAEGIRSARYGVAALLLAAVVAFWWMQWQHAPNGWLFPAQHASQDRDHERDGAREADDDD